VARGDKVFPFGEVNGVRESGDAAEEHVGIIWGD
jgi:hypothetical protein